MIKVKDLSRDYGDFRAVNKVSFSIPKGQIVGLLGHNGAGKTTIMKMLTGYLEPSEGSIDIDSQDINEYSQEIKAKIGYLPEASPVYSDMRVIQYLEFVCDLRGIAKSDRSAAIKAVVARTGLLEKVYDRASTLSKGYRQRLGIAQAIIHKPQILILDEPTSGLDPSQIEEVRKLIKELSSDATVILSTHIMQEVEAVCDRVIIILRGEVASDSLLGDLQDTNRLRISIDQEAGAAKPVLSGIDGISMVEVCGNGGKYTDFALEVSGEISNVAPVVAEQVIERGWKLLKLEREHHNLETVFRNINRGLSGGANE